ncbi:uncharacterized protein LOC143516551 isoform X2 [Brachyhypopomus gauderio]|uniref:uncharacterized protein LOC143516551 isoform X2 n=1 Tax=Brachyhypopomus gauderio TaxID=698409 RepID=UPI004042C90A
MESIYENFNIEPSKRLSNEISAESEDDAYLNCEELEWHQNPKKPTDASEHTVQPVWERRPPSSNRTLKVLVVALSVLLLCALGAVCTLGSLYFSQMLSFDTLCEKCANAESRLLMQEHNTSETSREYETLKERYQRTHKLISKCNETSRKYEVLEERYQRAHELNSKCNEISRKYEVLEERYQRAHELSSKCNAAKLNWTQSQDHCGDQGGHLVIITSQAEQGFVSSHVKETHWIGLNDLETEGKWMWVNGKPLNKVTFWYIRPNDPDEPDNWKIEDLSGENCASLGNEGGNTDRWYDASCRKLKKCICEK